MATGAVLSVGGMTVPCDPQGTRATAEEWTTAFPDWRFELLGLVAEGDRVVAHMPYSGSSHIQSTASPRPGGSPTSTRWSSSASPMERSHKPGRSTTKPACGANSESHPQPRETGGRIRARRPGQTTTASTVELATESAVRVTP